MIELMASSRASAQRDLASAGGSSESVVGLPALSPDLHRVIEHPFGYDSRAFAEYLFYHPEVCTLDVYKAALVRVFYGGPHSRRSARMSEACLVWGAMYYSTGYSKAASFAIYSSRTSP